MTDLVETARTGVSLKDIAEFFGIYKIICRKNNRSYVGQSNNVLSRMGDHVRQLERGSHSNKALQSDYDLYGADAFDFFFLEHTTDYERREAHYIARTVVVDESLVYNTVRKVDGTLVGPVKQAIKNATTYDFDKKE